MECGDFFVLNTVSFTRGHPYKLYVSHCRTNVKGIFLRVVLLKYGTVYPQIGFILVHLVVFVVHCIT